MKLAARAFVGIMAWALATVMAMTTAQAAPAVYTIQLVTCDVVDARTDARVEARLNGDISSGWLVLDHGDDPHESGWTDSYTFTMQRLGPIRSVDIAVNPNGDPWCLEEVIVRGPDGVTVHPYHNWLIRQYPKWSPLRLQAV
ncbi:PLAT/LH2 domain-containing protein [Lentzea terrae]|uniref:PLAT/LH2 domain-containing protein n=1 Tax=Lentzea terrae TaxID=2200761 RepID=UPI000DD3DB43|nr:PLAT/LH2 domain-containing protein [Lentzea terrae]